MLKSKSVAKLIQDALNSISDEEKFVVFDSVGDYKGSAINGVLKQSKATIVPTMNYINANVPYTIEFVVPMQCGEDRVDNIVNIINSAIKTLNGKRKIIDGGNAIFLFDVINMGGLETRATTGQSLILSVSFSVDYSNNNDGTKYEIALINNPFSGTINTRYFKTIDDQISWYLEKINNAPFNEMLTPNINSLVITNQRYINLRGTDLNDLLMNNYAIIRETKWNEDVNYYYYEITNSTIGQYNLLTLDLKMDTLQTWYFKDEIEIPKCVIDKAHLSRVKLDYIKGLYKFDFNEDSPLFERETIRDVAKRPIKNQKFKFDMTNDADTDINNWFAENVSHWIYYYVSAGVKYTLRDAFGETITEKELTPIQYSYGEWSQTNADNNLISGEIVVLVAPIYKTDKKIYLPYNDETTKKYKLWDSQAIIRFLKDNENYANVQAIKNSILPPIPADGRYGALMEIDSNGNLNYNASSGTTMSSTLAVDTNFYELANIVEVYGGFASDEAFESCFGKVKYQDITKDLQMYVEEPFYKPYYTDDEILQGAITDPKLLNEDYSTYRLYIGGNTYDLPVSKTSSNPKFIYKEVLSPDITKAMVIYDPVNTQDSSNVFTEINKRDFSGFVIDIDLSMWFSNDSLDDYLATNKNNLQIMQNNRNSRFNEIGINSFAGALQTRSQAGAISGLIGLGANLGSFYNQKETEIANYNLSLDNMAQSPQSLSSLNSNALLIQSVSDLGIYIELQQPLSREQEIISEQFELYGYNVGKIGDVKEYDNIRNKWNYIQARIENIYGINMSNPIREDLKERFANGIRFWNIDKIDYTLINYENIVEENLG